MTVEKDDASLLLVDESSSSAIADTLECRLLVVNPNNRFEANPIAFVKALVGESESEIRLSEKLGRFDCHSVTTCGTVLFPFAVAVTPIYWSGLHPDSCVSLEWHLLQLQRVPIRLRVH